jgi:acyl carrier protein
VPSTFVPLDTLPLTPNGKVDRRMLSTIEHTHTEREKTYVAPHTPIEQVLAEIWAQTLGVERVSADDNFFELGGHSLLATRVLSRIEEVFPIDLPLRSLFEALTVVDLAERVEAIGRNAQIDVPKIAQVFVRLSQLSDDEVRAKIAQFPV